MLKRLILSSLKEDFFKKKVVILIGARQVGKTTLLHQVIKEFEQGDMLFLNCDEPETLQML